MSARRSLLAVVLIAIACKAGPGASASPTSDGADGGAPTPAAMGNTGVLDEESFKRLHELRADQAPPPRGVTIDLGETKAYLALPEDATPPLPGIVVIHEWWGLNDHIRHWTDRLAADGYAALAVDLYGGRVATDSDGAMALMKGVDETNAHAVLTAAHAFLADDPRVQAQRRGSIGWCFGGGWSLQHAIARSDLDAAVIYYGRLVEDQAQLAKIDAELLGVFGNHDKGIPPQSVDAFVAALQAAGKTIELHRYDADHGFANPSGARYDEASAADAWQHVRAFFARTLKDR